MRVDRGVMRLLVSVANADEASAALAGGAHVIDAKNPSAGALGAVSVDVLREICATVAAARPPAHPALPVPLVTAAIGDATDEALTEETAAAYTAAGAALVKVGFAGVTNDRDVERLLAAAVRGAHVGSDGSGVVAVAYADADRARSVAPFLLIDVA